MQIVDVGLDDPLFGPVVEALSAEYGERYGDFGTRYVSDEDARDPSAFDPPLGLLLVLVDGDTPVAAGGFKRFDDETAEVKRVWTAASHRRRGLSRTLMAAVEERARAAGYRSLYLTTGPRQPEAVAFYLATGWEPGFDLDAPPAGAHPFTKSIG